MRRRAGYLLAFLLLGGCVAAVGLLRWHRAGQTGKLGDQIVYFGGNSGEESQETPEDASGSEGDWTILPGGSETEKSSRGTGGGDGRTAAPGTTATPAVQPTASAGTAPVAATPKPSYPPVISHGKVQTYDTGTVVVGDTGYELYNYVNSAADRYAKAINKLTKTLDSGVQVYDIIPPTSIGIIYPDNKKKSLNSSSQEEALVKIEKKLSGREIFVPLYDSFMRHRREYLYFRTDHHWTQLGAYYAYRAFCEEKGMAPNPLSAYRKKSFPGFMGTFYQDSRHNKNLKKDTLEVYYPLSRHVTMEYTNSEGKKSTAPVVADVKNYGESMKYLAYIAGDNPYTVVKNKDKHDGTSCILVKESFGNAFVPFLVDHYETIYVIDYRYWEGKLASFVKKKRAKEVIVMNNISMTRNSYLIGKLSQICVE